MITRHQYMGQYHIEVMNVHHITYAFTVKTKLSFQEYIYGIQHLLIRTTYRGATAEMHILRLPSNYTTHFSGVLRPISRAKLTLW